MYENNAAVATNGNPFGRADLQAVPSGKKAKWEAAAYINLYMPNGKGGKRKVGAIKLFNERPEEARLIEWLAGDPNRVAYLIEQSFIDYQTSGIKPENGFALPDSYVPGSPKILVGEDEQAPE